ncbi:hypothetical protein EDD37DRAFT_660065 [Exophiala viscosa]|uniref:uncharacterized protein n=1 Tax=Exophiala viscosa TaxID=2486360 RepID=UPI00219373B5|nr:hypothetical protein EDD37DRAFT_660065 [Exophiala viscosa]
MSAAAVVEAPQAPHTLAAQQSPPSFRINRGHVAPSQLGWLRSTPAHASIDEIRQRLQDDGYVWVKSVLPREDVLAMREHFFSQFSGTGLLKPGTAPVEGIYNAAEDVSLHRGVGGGNPQGDEELRRLTDAHTTAQYLQFVNHVALRKMVRDITGWDEEVMLHRTLLRHCVPGGSSTGIHYDRLFLRGGDAFFLTAWVPIGDVSSIGGGLHYLSDSVRLGQALEDDYKERSRDFSEADKISAFNRNMAATGYLADHPEEFMREHRRVAEKEGTATKGFKWLIANFEAGDVVFHHPCTIHGSCGNDDPSGRIRLSTDLRFYEKKDFEAGRADNRWMNHWRVDDKL